MPFLVGVVGVTDSSGNRVDTPDENGDHAPLILQLGASMIGTKSTTEGGLTKVIVESAASGSSAPGVVSLAALKALAHASLTDKQTRPTFDVNVGWRYDSAALAGVTSSDILSAKPDDLSEGTAGRHIRLSDMPTVETFADLSKLVEGTHSRVHLKEYYAGCGFGGGIFIRRTTTAPNSNGGTVVKISTSVWWQRQCSGSIDISWFGAGAGDATHDTAALVAAIAAIAGDTSREIYFPFPPYGGNYLINSPIVIQATANQGLSLRGESHPSSGSAGDVRLEWVGGVTASSVLQILGGTGVQITNLAIGGGGDAKHCLHLCPFQGANPDGSQDIGVSRVTLAHVKLDGVHDITDAACLLLGPTIVGPRISQCDSIRFDDLLINGGLYVNADGVRTTIGANTKFFQISNTVINYVRYGFNFNLASGPISIWGSTVNVVTKAAFLIGQNANVSVWASDFEGVNALVDTPGVGAASGCLTLYQCECSQEVHGTVMPGIAFQAGHLRIIGGHYQWGHFWTITGATNATPIVVTAVAHPLVTGDLMQQGQILGNTAANGFFRVTKIDADHYSLQDMLTGANIAGSGAYTSGGVMAPSFKMQIFPPELNGVASAQNGGAYIEGAEFPGSKHHPFVCQIGGNQDLFDPAYAKLRNVRIQSIMNVGSDLFNTEGLGVGAGVPMPDIISRAQTSLLAQTYTTTNHSDARSLDETGATTAQVAHALGTLIADLKTEGLLK